MRERVLAVAAAVCLIAVALLVRSWLAGSDDDGGGKQPSGTPVVACTPDLRDICEALADAGEIAPNPPTLELDQAAAPDDEIDGWITWDPAHLVANDEAGATVWGEATLLGAGTEGWLLTPAGADALTTTDGCAPTPAWTCIPALVGSGLAVGVGPLDSAEGLARFAPLVDAYADPDGDSTDFLTSDIRDLVQSPPAGPDDTTTGARNVVTRGDAASSVVIGAQDLLAATAASTQGQQRSLTTLVPTPTSTMAVVLVGRAGTDVTSVADTCDESIVEALGAVGMDECEARLADETTAGRLFQVYRKAG